MHEHYCAVVELLNADPLSPAAAALRIEIADLERSDPTLIAERLAVFAAHVNQIGQRSPADRHPEGSLLT